MSRINAYGLSSAVYAKLYGVWKNMIDRCYNEKSERFYTYGERGIRVCEAWKTDFHSFARWALENGWSPSLSIERKDVDGMYCPENCTLITMAAQMRNRTCNVYVIINGETKCLTEWCELYDVPFKRTWNRYRNLGITDPKILFSKAPLPSARGAAKTLKHSGFGGTA